MLACQTISGSTQVAEMAECCPPGSWPAVLPPADYKPLGTEDKIDDLPIYTIGTGEKAIIVLPEVFGWNGRLKGIADTLANEGFLVVMPDCHRGETAATQTDFGAWISKFSWDAVISKDFERMFKWLEGKGAKSIGAIGFCWGVWAFCKAASVGVPLKAGVGPHPSTRLEGMMGGDELEMMKKVEIPVLLMPAGNDPDTVKPGGDVATAIASKGGSSHPYPEMEHGWASRGDVAVPAVKRDVEDCMKRAVDFFKSNL